MSAHALDTQVQVTGESGPWVVFRHSTGTDLHSFDAQTAHLAAGGWRTLAWDLPGHGGSRPDGTACSVARLVDGLNAVLTVLSRRAVGLSAVLQRWPSGRTHTHSA